MSIATTVPTIKQGQSITFDNLDAPLGNGIWHTITDCAEPVRRLQRHRVSTRQRFHPVRLRRARRRGRALVRPREVVDAHEPPAGHVHVLLPDSPVHAGCVPRRRQLSTCAAALKCSSARSSRRSDRGRLRRLVRVRRPRAGEAEAHCVRSVGEWRAEDAQRAVGHRAPVPRSYVGYRIKELFGDSVLKHVVVGRTPAVTGDISIANGRVDRRGRDSRRHEARERSLGARHLHPRQRARQLRSTRPADSRSRGRSCCRRARQGATTPRRSAGNAADPRSEPSGHDPVPRLLERADDRRRRHRADRAQRLRTSRRRTP